MRTVAHRVAPAIRAGDLVVSTQPEQVPALYRYLPRGVVYLTPLGPAVDPRLTDWRYGLQRLRAGRADDTLLPGVDGLAPGRRILLVTPANAHARRRRGRAPSASARASGAPRSGRIPPCARSARPIARSSAAAARR